MVRPATDHAFGVAGLVLVSVEANDNGGFIEPKRSADRQLEKLE